MVWGLVGSMVNGFSFSHYFTITTTKTSNYTCSQNQTYNQNIIYPN